jgi:ABC-type nickel/cobalt efflux system permease component RcnA
LDTLAAIVAAVLEAHRQLHSAVAGELRAIAAGSGSFWAAAATALGLGMVHALTPSHGKAVLFTYFLGRAARPLAGMAAAAQIAALHVGSATLLVSLVGISSTVLGRSGGAAYALQAVSAAALVAVGAWYLYRAVAPSSAGDGAHRHALSGLTLAVGMLPCPLTMLILSTAFAHASLAIGLALVLVMGAGIAATIAMVGLIGILARRGLAAMAGIAPLLRGLEIASAAMILALGLSAIAAL